MTVMQPREPGQTMQPIGQVPKRLSTHGRIRTGMVKKGEKFPRSLKNFRLTSPDQEAIETLANMYGGEARPWSNPKANPPNQFEVVTTSDVLAVQLVPASVKLSYEKWGNGFLNRRCDGEMVFARKPGPKGQGPIEQMMACLCNEKQDQQCVPVTRLNVILPGVRFKGVWLLQSNGWNVFSEMPGMMMLVDSLRSGELVDAVLKLEPRQADGGGKKFVVPVIQLEEELQALADGNRQQMVEASAVPVALPERSVADPLADLDDIPVEGELVEDN